MKIVKVVTVLLGVGALGGAAHTGWAGQQIQVEHKQVLPMADDRHGLEGEVKGLRERVVALEARLKALEGAVQVSGVDIKIVGAGGVHIQGGGAVIIQGGTLRLNGGGKPLARVGDPVIVQGASGPMTGQITGGSPTVSAQ